MCHSRFIFAVFILLATHVKGQLSGNAFLLGQANHAGILVKFNAHPGTAVSDSTYTTSSGSYSINIAGGVYDVVFSKSGYLTSFYNGGTAVVLTNTVVLANDTLEPGNQVMVSGNICGNWSDTNTYIVTGNITIPANCTLTIQPGTTVKFNGNYSILDDGVLIAAGTSVSPIIFTSNNSTPLVGDWQGITAHNSATIFDHCLFEYCAICIEAIGYNTTLSNSILHDVQVAYRCYNCSPHVYNNEIYNCLSTASAAIGLWIEGSGAIIECNYIHNNTSGQHNGYGMITGSNLVRNNIIHDINGGGAVGIDSRGNDSRIQNNYIYNCGKGVTVSNSNNPPFPIVSNNTFINNQMGIGVAVWSGPCYNPTIVNNIIIGGTNGIFQQGTTPSGYNVSHNLVWGASNAYNNVQVVGIGQIIATNSQGDPIDSYYNLAQDPLFAGGIPPVLNLSSPCFGAGDTTYNANIGYDTSYSCSAVTSISGFSKRDDEFSIMPNPAEDFVLVKCRSTNIRNLQVIDISGRVVLTTRFKNSINLNLLQLEKGIYTICLESEETRISRKLIVLSR